MTLNPYEPTRQPVTVTSDAQPDWYLSYVVPVAQVAFWFGAILFVLGSFISFYPGAETNWFVISASLTAFGLLVPSRRYRVPSILIVGVCLYWAYFGYHRGIEYREKQKIQQG